jgi:hypothetical protein
MKPLTLDQGYDNVLLGQSYRTPHGAMIHVYGAMVEWYWQGKTKELGRKTCPSATLSTTNPTWIDPGANPGLHGERPATNRLSHGTVEGGDSMFPKLLLSTHQLIWRHNQDDH